MRILSISFGNFYAFSEYQTVNFLSPSKRTHTDGRFINFGNFPAVASAAIILGHNAAGKTHAIKALAFLIWFMTESSSDLKSGEKIPCDPFAFAPRDASEKSDFELCFESEGEIYVYNLSINSRFGVVESEELHSINKDTRRGKYLFKRMTFNEDEDIKTQELRFGKRTIKPHLRDNCSIISASTYIDNTGLEGVVKSIRKTNTNITVHKTAGPEEDVFFQTVSYYDANPSVFEYAKTIVKSLDLGISDLSIKRNDIPNPLKDFLRRIGKVSSPGFEIKFGNFKLDTEDDKFLSVSATHTVDGVSYELPLENESKGTRDLFSILRYIAPALISGDAVVIDEFEAGLHPHMVEHIVELFLSPATNPKGAQLIFTSHNIGVLNHLDKSQIFLVEKDAKTLKSTIYSLTDVEDVRPRDNFVKSYLSGKYGAVPRL